jgi:hypothetical protein
MAGCEMTEDEFTAFPRTVLGYIAARSVDGSINFVLGLAAHVGDPVGRPRGPFRAPERRRQGGLFMYGLLFVSKRGTPPNIDKFELG